MIANGVCAFPIGGISPTWRWFFACTVMLLGGACVDGYPTEGTAVPHPLDMTQVERLVEINRLGGELESGVRWSYELLPGCTLRVSGDVKNGSSVQLDVPLLGADVKIAQDKAEETFEVTLHRQQESSSPGWVVLESQNWGDVSWMQLLLRAVQKGCLDTMESRLR